MKGGRPKCRHPINDTGAAQVYWDAAQTSTNRSHGSGCELGIGCQNHKSGEEKKALQKNVWINIRNDPKLKMGVSLFAGETLTTETENITE